MPCEIKIRKLRQIMEQQAMVWPSNECDTKRLSLRGGFALYNLFMEKLMTLEMNGSKNNLFHHPWKFCFHVIVFMGHYMYFDEFHVLFRAHVKTNHFHGPWKSLIKEFTGHETHCGNFRGQFMGHQIWHYILLGKFMPSNKAIKLHFAGFKGHKKIFKGFSREIHGIFRQLWFIVNFVLVAVSWWQLYVCIWSNYTFCSRDGICYYQEEVKWTYFCATEYNVWSCKQ